METTKILFLAANPFNTDRLSLDEELRAIKEQVREASSGNRFEVISVEAARPDDWLQALNAQRFRMVHFSGHGTKSGALQHVGDDGRAQQVSPDALKNVFRALKGEVRFVIFNACYSRPQAQALVKEIDCAIGMNDTIEDEAAITFIRAFYRALFSGRSVENAFAQGKAALSLQGLAGDQIPELFVRSGVKAAEISLTGASTRSASEAISLFYCYAPEDEQFCRALDKQLIVMQRQGLITKFESQDMQAGDLTPEKMQSALDAAQIILLIVSTDFFASDAIYTEQLKQAMNRRELGAARVIPIIVRPTQGWERSAFGNLAALPKEKRPVSAWKGRREEALYSIAVSIRNVVEGMKKESK